MHTIFRNPTFEFGQLSHAQKIIRSKVWTHVSLRATEVILLDFKSALVMLCQFMLNFLVLVRTINELILLYYYTLDGDELALNYKLSKRPLISEGFYLIIVTIKSSQQIL